MIRENHHGIATAQQMKRERRGFLALVDALEGPASPARVGAHGRVARGLRPETTVPHLLALWPEEERKRGRRRVRVPPVCDRVLLVGYGFALACLVALAVRDSRSAAILPFQLSVLCTLAALLTLASHASRSLTRRQRGMLRLLVGVRDVRLVPLYLEALESAPAENDRRILSGYLTELLPLYVDADTPCLNARQRHILLEEIGRRVRRGKRRRRHRDRSSAFLKAALYALESEIARSEPLGRCSSAAREARALQTAAAAARDAGRRDVAQAAEDCLVRLHL
jgi:hypothetical protein